MPFAESEAYTATQREARERIILEHMQLVRRIAHWFAGFIPRWIDPADLVSAGVIGLIKAVDRFDAERGVAFETFASHYIRGAIQDHLRSQDPLSYSARSKVRKLDRVSLELERRFLRTPHLSEVAAAAGCTEVEAADLMSRASTATLYSLDDLLARGIDEANPPGNSPPDILASLEKRQLLEVMVQLLRELPQVDRLVVTLYYYEGMKMKDIGAVLDVSESRVSQIHARSLALLRARLRERLETE